MTLFDDFHDQNNNPLTITQIDAQNANISGNTLSDTDPSTYDSGNSLDGHFHYQVTYHLL